MTVRHYEPFSDASCRHKGIPGRLVLVCFRPAVDDRFSVFVLIQSGDCCTPAVAFTQRYRCFCRRSACCQRQGHAVRTYSILVVLVVPYLPYHYIYRFMGFSRAYISACISPNTSKFYTALERINPLIILIISPLNLTIQYISLPSIK